jgi:hypothetical protein
MWIGFEKKQLKIIIKIMEKTKIICILDRSGSMGVMTEDAIGGFNTFLSQQQEVEGEAIMTIIQFDNEYDIICKDVNIQDVKPLNRDTYVPRGSTSLYDAVGKTINDEIDMLGMTPIDERCDKTLVVILTDGEENSSREFRYEQIADMIKEQREVYKWEFIFLAANQDAMATAQSFNISSGNAFTYTHDTVGITEAYNKMSMASTKYRCCASTSDTSNLMDE